MFHRLRGISVMEQAKRQLVWFSTSQQKVLDSFKEKKQPILIDDFQIKHSHRGPRWNSYTRIQLLFNHPRSPLTHFRLTLRTIHPSISLWINSTHSKSTHIYQSNIRQRGFYFFWQTKTRSYGG